MEVTVKRIKDADKAIEIARTHHGTYFNDEGMVELRKSVEKDVLFGAYKGDELVGFVTYKEINPEAVELVWIAILSDHQGQGVGTALVEESLNNLEEKYRICEVKTLAESVQDEGYEKTRRFYKKLGFIPLEIIDPYPSWGEGNPCQILVKILKQVQDDDWKDSGQARMTGKRS